MEVCSIMSYSKYKSKTTYVDGRKFSSKKEANRFVELKLMERAKAIHDLQMQVPFPLIKKSPYGREIKYYADFVYYEGDRMVVEDTKGYRTDVYKLKKRLMAEIYGIEIKET